MLCAFRDPPNRGDCDSYPSEGRFIYFLPNISQGLHFFQNTEKDAWSYLQFLRLPPFYNDLQYFEAHIDELPVSNLDRRLPCLSDAFRTG